MNKVFGIDLGTTYSCIAYIDDSNKPAVLKNAEAELTTPSVVYFEDKDNVVVGSAAKESSKMYPEQVVSYIKRSMGKENANLVINGVEMSPEEISSYVLKKCVQDANETLKEEGKIKDGEEIKDVVITCPAYFGINERTATKTAGEIAGLNVIQIINEPTAAAITYGVNNDKEEKVVLVYDLGGGTFDITLIHIKPGEVKVICTGGDHNLGGKDWDEKLLLYLDDEFQKQTKKTESILDDPETLQELALSVEKAKKLLSSKEKAPISINAYGERVRIELTRDKFDELTNDLLERTISLTNEMINDATKKGYSKSDISEILLVGGSSRMPQVMKRVESEYGISTKMFDPDESVAKGAAIYANNQTAFNDILAELAKKTGKSVDEVKDEIDSGKDINQLASDANLDIPTKMLGPAQTKITNVSSRSFGTIAYIDDDIKKLFNLIMKNDELPAIATDRFRPVSDGQKSVEIKVLENLSSEKAIDVELGSEIGTAVLELPSGITTKSIIELTFKLNENGLLELKAIELQSGKLIETSFETKNAISDKEKEQAMKRMNDSDVN